MNAAQKTAERRWRGHKGFTLLEVLMVAAIIVILATLSAARYDQAMVRAHEAALSQDLSEMNKAIQNYTSDKEAAPTSLDDLVQAQYLGKIPNDPITGAPDWTTENCDLLVNADQNSTGICSVHSSSDKVSPFTNTPYSSW
ncbi:MAG TPA: type II secretion system protein [Candidatus Acidoferrales bacterium]